jgi:hypothetical protein
MGSRVGGSAPRLDSVLGMNVRSAGEGKVEKRAGAGGDKWQRIARTSP